MDALKVLTCLEIQYWSDARCQLAGDNSACTLRIALGLIEKGDFGSVG